MTERKPRTEEMENAVREELGRHIADKFTMDTIRANFIRGAEWADANPLVVPPIKMEPLSELTELEAELLDKCTKWKAIAEEMAEALSHPDINELSCDCGIFEEGKHICIKCNTKAILAKWEKVK